MTELDGFQVYGFFHGGTSRVAAARRHLDRINVFPVPDGDTGTNLHATLAGAVEAVSPTPSAAATLRAIADAALLSARGNSGVIMAQFVGGLSEAVRHAVLRTRDFAEAAEGAYRRARAAVGDPREGTILTVIGAWASSLLRFAPHHENLASLLAAAKPDLERSLGETTALLPELRRAGVVDAGAAGFVEFVEGARAYLASGAPRVESGAIEWSTGETAEAAPGAPPGRRYCAEALVTGASLDLGAIKAAIAAQGDSEIVAGGGGRAKIHVHVDDPARLMESLGAFGRVTGQKADDMLLQYRDGHDRAARVAIVTDSSCDLPADLVERHRIHVVPLVVNADSGEYLDRLTLDAAGLRALVERERGFPKTAQPPAHFFSRLYSFLCDYYESVVAVHLSAKLSGTHGASERAAGAWSGRVTAFDSRTLSGALSLVVLRAAEAAEAGAGVDEIRAKLERWSANSRIFVSVKSLRYMVRGGRVSPLKGLAAKLLNLKPIVSVDAEGKSALYGKAFSERANLRALVRMTVETHRATPLWAYSVGHSGVPDKAAALAAELERALGFPPLYVSEISSVVALNAGPGAVSVSMLAD